MRVRWNSIGGTILIREAQMKKIEISQIKKQIEILATFMPDEILKMPALELHKIQNYVGVLLFADVSGFTPLCEKYNKTGKGGIYRLTATLNAYIGAIVEVIYFYGGDVLKFSGDAFLAMWKAEPDERLYKVIHNVIVCALFIQQTLGRFETEVNVLLKVKLAISCGNMTFSLIGDDHNKHYVLLGPAINAVKAAEHASVSGDVVIAPTAWGHIPEESYEVTYGDAGNVKVWKCLYKPNEKAKKDEYDQKHEIVQKLCDKHIQHRNTIYAMKSFDHQMTDSKLTEKFITSLPQRVEMKAAPQKWIASDLRPFIIKPVQEQVDENQPVAYLTEMREVTIQFINIVPTTFYEPELVVMVDAAYQIICHVVGKLLGVVNKVSLFDKDAMILVLFGLRGIKHEMESQNALMSGYKIRRAIAKLQGVKSVSVGITNGLVYCGVVGHPLRREYTVIGGSVNKAARIMCAYPHKVTCDHKTYKNSKLSSYYFQLQTPLKLKGIEDPGHIFEYNEDFEDIIDYQKELLPILGRRLEIELVDLVVNYPNKSEGYSGVCFYGKMKMGKSRILRTALADCYKRKYAVAVVELCGITQRPYFCISLLYKQLYDFKAKLKSNSDIIKDLPRDLWSLNDILQTNTSFNRKHRILNMFRDMVKDVKTVIFVDNMQYIDLQSYDIIETTIRSEGLRLICAGHFEHETWDIQWKMSMSKVIKMFEVECLSQNFTPPLICQFLRVKGAPKKLISLIDASCEGRPGWVQSCLLRLVNDARVEVKYINKTDWERKYYVFPNANLLVNDGDRADLDEQEGDVLAVAEMTDNFSEKSEDLTYAAISLDLFDSFTPYQQLIIKTGAVLGEIFTRSLMIVMLKYPNEQLFASAIKHLFEEDVFDCGTKYINCGGFLSKQLNCLCYMTEDDFLVNTEKNIDFPKYAFCKVIHFKNKSLRLVAYELLPANQRKELHLRTTDVLENQNNSCPNCLRDNAAAIITLRNFRDTLYYCTDIYKPYTVTDKTDFEIYYHPTHIKDIIRGNIGPVNETEETSGGSLDESLKLILKRLPKRRLWDPSTCFCLEILTRVYSDLIYHSERAGHLGKRIFFLTQYGVVLLAMNECEYAIPLLNEASELCMVDASDPNSLITDSFRKLNLGKIHMLLAEAHFRMSKIEESKNHLLICFRQYNAPMLSLKYTLLNRLLTRPIVLSMKNTILYSHKPKNSILKSDFGVCLNLLSSIYAAEGYWGLAKRASSRSISLLNDSNSNVAIMCDVYSNAIDYYNYCGDGHVCEKLERCIGREVLRLYTGNVFIELYALSKLINVIFQTRVMDGRIASAIHLGFRAMYLNNTIQAYNIQSQVAPVLASVLLLKQRIEDGVEIMKILFNLGKHYDDSILLSYYSFCVELYIETNFVLEDIDNCENYAIKYFTTKMDPDARNENEFKMILYLYAYFLRKKRWSNASRWKNLLKTENITKTPSFRSISNLMKYTECCLILQIRNIELKKTFIHLEEQRIKIYLKSCKEAAKRWKVFLPRYYHYMAYFCEIKRRHSKAKWYLRKGLNMAREQGNVLDHCWIRLNENVWNGGFSFKHEMKDIDWKLAKTYSPLQWAQIMYAFPTI